MNKQTRISKILHWIVLLSFFLPFFYTGCQPESKEEKEQAKLDSIEMANNPIDSLAPENSENDTLSSTKSDSTNSEKEKKDELLSIKIAHKFPYLKPLLIPEKDTYSGIAVALDSFFYLFFFGVFNSFFLLIISLTAKFIQKEARKLIVFLEILSIIFLSISHPYSFDSKTLWGFWVCLGLIILLTVYDFYLIKLNTRFRR